MDSNKNSATKNRKRQPFKRRANPESSYRLYESKKAEIQRLNLSPAEYEAAIDKLAKSLKI